LKQNTLERRCLLIINPVSGKKQVLRHIPGIIRTFMDAGYMVTTMVTGGRGEATNFVLDYGRDFDLICCTGGDGTLNEAMSGLISGDIRVPLGYIPCGSTNDFAASRKLSTDVELAAKNIASGRLRSFDVGRFGGHYFSYVAAFGAFSWLSYTTDQRLKNTLGHTAYILDGIKDISKVKSHHVKIICDGTDYEGDYIFGAVCNSTSVAGVIELPEDLVDTLDGKFEVLLVSVPKTIHELENTLRAIKNKDFSLGSIKLFQAEDIHIENPDGLQWSLDGECPGYYENVHISPIPGFLTLQG